MWDWDGAPHTVTVWNASCYAMSRREPILIGEHPELQWDRDPRLTPLQEGRISV